MHSDLAQTAQSLQLQCVCMCVAVRSHEDSAALALERELAQRGTLEQLFREKESEITEIQFEKEKLINRCVKSNR